jgi:NADPH-dependent glutamate synthase beta subunit-like oxidoreductase
VSTQRRIAIVRAGPSGFYATDQLLRAGFEVDLYDALARWAGVSVGVPGLVSSVRGGDQAARDAS